MKKDRIEFQTSHQERTLLITAPTYLGMNLSAFCRAVALERSAEIIKGNTLYLSDKDTLHFLTALENPPRPNENLKKALSEYNR